MTHRVINFNAGPAGLPLPALEKARDELLDFEGSGMSILEHSHRGRKFEAVHHEAQSLIRALLGVPEGYAVLFLQGGASAMFAQVPMNLLVPGRRADYAVTGRWGEKALAEAKIVGDARDMTPMGGVYDRIPAPEEHRVDPSAAYLHVTSNNTLEGSQYWAFPDPGAVPLVADMSSDFLGRTVDVARFSLIYAGAQKNVGPSGVVVVIARDELLRGSRRDVPKIFRFATFAEHDSLYNTPPTFAVYLMRNVLQWAKGEGGVPALEARNRAKAAAVYSALDAAGGFYRRPVAPADRSQMNLVFFCPSEELDARFVAESTAAGMVGLKGHRSTGGIRASLYNAVSLADAEALASFVGDFARRYG